MMIWNMFYPTNKDFKIEYRPYNWSNFGINTTFEIVIHSLSPPITITSDFSEISGNLFEGWSALHLLDSSCNIIDVKSIYYNEVNDTIYTSNDTMTTLIAELMHEVGIKQMANERIQVFPNPCLHKIQILSKNQVITKVNDFLGNLLLISDKKSIDINQLNSGIYFISIYDIKGNLLKVEKIIKQ